MTHHLFDQQQVGQRIADARVEAELTQADLAQVLGVDRTAVAKIEGGTRRVSAVELARIASKLGRPLDWFLVESPPAIVSRRMETATSLPAASLDRAVEKAARDVEFLVQLGALNPVRTDLQLGPPRNLNEAERAATKVRRALGLGTKPLPGLDQTAERLGLLCFSLALGDKGGDGAYISLREFGVTVINGDADPGRRRYTLAHEIGHHVFADEYSTDISLLDSRDETERRINAFAAHLLLPRRSVADRWGTWPGSPREKAIRLGMEYRVSWSALCGHLRNLSLVAEGERQALMSQPPTRADYLEAGEAIVKELCPPSIPPGYARAVLRAFRSGKLGANRTVDLLWQSVTRQELPTPDTPPIESLQREFDPLP
jgi:Zn-dependent peptidase ImmA (M78 family)/transcriptional regulator with XRE-family HTH domain